MSPAVFFAVLAAAMMHAGWNALLKLGGDRFQGMMLISICQGLFGAALVSVEGLPASVAWPWLAASVAIHTGYNLFLVGAYNRGDLSRVYPIARGAAPLMVAVAGLVVLTDRVSGPEFVGIALVGVGVMLMARGVRSAGEAMTLVPFALGSAACTAAYSIVDGIGGRASGNPSSYTGWLFLIDGMVMAGIGLGWRGAAAMPRQGRLWRNGLAAGFLSFSAYWIVIWAMTRAPIQLVTALRETSVLFAVLIGVVFLGERAHPSKLLAGAVIAAGVVAMKL